MTAVLSLWSDDPADTDLLSFDAVAQTVTDALLDEALDPVALGLSGSWGSGKTTVLGLVAEELDRRTTPERKVLVIQTDPWRYDPATGAKAIKLAATSSVTLQIPSFEKLVDLVKPKEDGDEESVRGLEEFRDEFAELINSDDLQHVRAVAVLVDDLDRCLPETVVESLEASAPLTAEYYAGSYCLNATQRRLVSWNSSHGTSYAY